MLVNFIYIYTLIVIPHLFCKGRDVIGGKKYWLTKNVWLKNSDIKNPLSDHELISFCNFRSDVISPHGCVDCEISLWEVLIYKVEVVLNMEYSFENKPATTSFMWESLDIASILRNCTYIRITLEF